VSLKESRVNPCLKFNVSSLDQGAALGSGAKVQSLATLLWGLTPASMLKLFYRIKEGEFFELGKKHDVTEVLLKQLRKLYADNSINREEAVMKTELQELFGLCYDDFLEINNIAAKEALERGADSSQLDTFI
jgi:hypothetical protein